MQDDDICAISNDAVKNIIKQMMVKSLSAMLIFVTYYLLNIYGGTLMHLAN